MGERDADDVRDENHEATGFFRRMAIIPPAPPRHSRRPLPVIPAGPFPVIPAGPLSVIPAGPLSVIPAVFSGNPVKTVFLQGSIRKSYPFDKASMTSES